MYAGYGFAVGDATFDLKYIQYRYPGQESLNFGEYHAGASYMNFTLSLDYSNDTPLADVNSGLIDDNTTFHESLSYALALPYEFTVTPTIGHYDFKDHVVGSQDDYNYYSVALTRSWLDMNWAVTWTDTDLSDRNCVAFAGRKDYCDSTIALSVSKTF